MLKSYGDIDYPIAFDFENGYRNKRKYKKSNTNIIKTYCDYLENRGYDTSVYSYMDFLKYIQCITKRYLTMEYGLQDGHIIQRIFMMVVFQMFKCGSILIEEL